MGSPVAVMSFNRPQFLIQTLESLKAQAGNVIDSHEIHLFQDGAVNRWSRLRYAAQGDIDDCVAAFRSVFPRGHVHDAGANIGICENFCRAEDYFFVENRFDTAWFFEDDMILSPVYFEMMARLETFAQRNTRLAYFSAYGNYYASPDEVAANQDVIIPLDHHWAFGLRREAWTKMRASLEGYYALVRGQDYARRDHRAIYAYFAKSGMVPRGSSQDAAKTWACARLGLLRLRTFAPYARYIGTQGAHMTPERFAELGFGRTVMLDEAVAFKAPDDNAMTEMADEQRRLLRDIFRNEYGEITSTLPARKFNPMRRVTRDDVVDAYRLLLHRQPESEDIIERHAGKTPACSLIRGLVKSEEFSKVPERRRPTPPPLLDPQRLLNREDLISAYRLILHRNPDSEAAIEQYADRVQVLGVVLSLTSSSEFREICNRIESLG